MVKNIIIIGCLVLLAHMVAAQKVENVAITKVGDDLVVTFDLMPKESVLELYKVTVVASKGTSQVELQEKNGKATDIRPGSRLQFVFDGKQNFRNFRGNMDFSIRAIMTYSPMSFLSPTESTKIKKGKALEIKWRGGLKDVNYDLELYRADKAIVVLEKDVQEKSYTWAISKKTKAAGNYTIKLSSTTNPNSGAVSSEFRIKNKIPLVVKVVPVLLIGGVVAILLKDSGGGSGDGGFPNPPDLP